MATIPGSIAGTACTAFAGAYTLVSAEERDCRLLSKTHENMNFD
jgi:hypothetical protein